MRVYKMATMTSSNSNFQNDNIGQDSSRSSDRWEVLLRKMWFTIFASNVMPKNSSRKKVLYLMPSEIRQEYFSLKKTVMAMASMEIKRWPAPVYRVALTKRMAFIKTIFRSEKMNMHSRIRSEIPCIKATSFVPM